jgi:hypothetical protein
MGPTSSLTTDGLMTRVDDYIYCYNNLKGSAAPSIVDLFGVCCRVVTSVKWCIQRNEPEARASSIICNCQKSKRLEGSTMAQIKLTLNQDEIMHLLEDSSKEALKLML